MNTVYRMSGNEFMRCSTSKTVHGRHIVELKECPRHSVRLRTPFPTPRGGAPKCCATEASPAVRASSGKPIGRLAIVAAQRAAWRSGSTDQYRTGAMLSTSALRQPDHDRSRVRQRPGGASDQKVGIQSTTTNGGPERAPVGALGSDGQLGR